MESRRSEPHGLFFSLSISLGTHILCISSWLLFCIWATSMNLDLILEIDTKFTRLMVSLISFVRQILILKT